MYRLLICIALLTGFMRMSFLEPSARKKLGKEQIAIDHGLELYKNLQNHESDCFKRATIMLTDGCHSLTLDSEKNMEYALMLTKCELASANVAIPKECTQEFSLDEERRHREIVLCAKKLHNTPQTWTSYSGYFKDVLFMCFALRYPIEKEFLENLHRNITLNQIKNFEILRQQQEYLINWRNEEFKILDRLKTSQIQLTDQMGIVQGTHLRSAEQIQSIFDTLVLLQNQTTAVMNRYNEVVRYHVNEMQVELNQLVIRQEYELDSVVSTIVDGLQTIDKNIESMIEMQENVLQTWTKTKDMQNEYLETWKTSIDHVNTNLNNVLQKSLDSIKSIQHDIATIHHQIKFITAPVGWVFHAASGLASLLGRFALNVFMHTFVFYHLNSIFGDYNLFKRLALSSTGALAHQMVINQLFPSSSSDPYEAFIKMFIILSEWALKHYYMTKKESRGQYSLFVREYDVISSSSSSSSNYMSSETSVQNSSSSSSTSGPPSPHRIRIKKEDDVDGQQQRVPKIIIPRFINDSENPLKDVPIIPGVKGERKSMTAIIEDKTQVKPENDSDAPFEKYNFHRYYYRKGK